MTGKAFDTLVYFLERPGQVIDRSELLDAVWPNVIVEENNLSQVVAALRRALGDGLIATVPRRGYQFTADVRAGEDRPRVFDRFRVPRRLHLGFAGLAIALLATAIVAFRSEPGGAPGAPRIAVLPCENLSPEPDDEYFAAGLHEEILNRLAQLNGIEVAARSAVMSYAAAERQLQNIAADLGASAIVECSVRYAGSAIMVTAQLIDADTESQTWSQSYPGTLSDLDGLFDMQADIAISIASALDMELVATDQARLAAPSTDSPEAYVEFLRALDARSTHLEAGLEHLQRAIALDPDFADAYVARALLRLTAAWERALRSNQGGDVRNASFDLMREASLANADALHALDIDPEQALAHFVLGATLLPFAKDSAEERFERVLARSPNDPFVLYLIAGFYLSELRTAEASRLLDKIKQLAPSFFHIRTYLVLTRDFAGLRTLEQRAVASNPSDASAHVRLAFAEVLNGDERAARRELRVAEELAGESGITPSGPAIYLYGRLNLLPEAESMFARLIEHTETGEFASDTEWMVANLGIGDIDSAYHWASQVASRPAPIWAADELWLVLNPLGDLALEEHRFLQLRRKLGFRR